jgi:hypothetical protein
LTERKHQQLLKLERAATKVGKKKMAAQSIVQRNNFEPLNQIGYTEWSAMRHQSDRSGLRRSSSLPHTVEDADLPPPGMDNVVLVAKKPKSKD